MTATFGKRLALACERRDFSFRDVAKRSGIAESNISHFVNDHRQPSADNIRRLARTLDITADYLLGLSDDTRRLSP